jgi:ABC-type Fe3+/spermidine/putrescine transport system ATPase subunit
MSIRIEQLTKFYQGVPVVNDVTLEVHTGEFFVLLGPSGSGKSTLLRALAGLIHIDHGRIALHGRDVTELPARARGVGVVFQHYALFGHMTVAENIEFALRVRRMRAAERRRRRRELLQLVALSGFDERFPSQLSGGQQQRVAVARALAHEPAVLLFDEPFGALDAKIRVELRETVRAVQRRLGMTIILVTHDQGEAFALADRIGIMQMGRLLETGGPESLYLQPATRFVARFLGAANLFLGETTPQGLRLGEATLAAAPAGAALAGGAGGAEAVLVVRPEDIELAPGAGAPPARQFARGVVRELTFAGHQQHLSIQLDAASKVKAATSEEPGGAPAVTVEALRSATERAALPLAVGEPVWLGARRVHALPTPISSFQLLAAADALLSNPLLAQLVRSMQARIIRPQDAAAQADRLDAGICVLPLDANATAAIAAAAARGARRILALPAPGALPTRMLVHGSDPAGHGELQRVVASLMRHLPIPATAVALQPHGAQDGAHDARGGLHDGHGLALRTERFPGTLPAWLAQIASHPDPVLVVLEIQPGASALATALRGELAALFSAGSRAAVLLCLGAQP